MKTQFAEVSIQEVKNYWDARPCNIRDSNDEVQKSFLTKSNRIFSHLPNLENGAETNMLKGGTFCRLDKIIAKDSAAKTVARSRIRTQENLRRREWVMDLRSTTYLPITFSL
jgi:hypothetical protein